MILTIRITLFGQMNKIDLFNLLYLCNVGRPIGKLNQVILNYHLVLEMRSIKLPYHFANIESFILRRRS